MFVKKQMKKKNEDSQDEKTKRKMTLKVFNFWKCYLKKTFLTWLIKWQQATCHDGGKNKGIVANSDTVVVHMERTTNVLMWMRLAVHIKITNSTTLHATITWCKDEKFTLVIPIDDKRHD